MATNEITITNFITNYITNYTEITNIGLNNSTISNLIKLSLFDFITLITSIILCIVPIVALIYSILLNRKLNERNEQQAKEIDNQKKVNNIIYLIQSDLESSINIIANICCDIETNLFLDRNYKKLNENRVRYIHSNKDCVNSILNFFNKITLIYKTDNFNASLNFSERLEKIRYYLNKVYEKKIEDKSIANNEYELLLNYYKNINNFYIVIKKYMYSKINNSNDEKINDVYINEVYQKIEEIHKEFDKVL